ncbi:hypothetical protein Tco_0368291 [Tanacetum coccineum]
MFNFDELRVEKLVRHCLANMNSSGRTSDNELNLIEVISQCRELTILGEGGGEAFCDRGGDYGRGVVLLQTSLTEMRGFLEKFEEGFEEDMKNEDG